MGNVLALNMIKLFMFGFFASRLTACSMMPAGSAQDMIVRQKHPTPEFQNHIQAGKPQVAANIPSKPKASARFVKTLTQDDGTEVWVTGNNIALYMRDGLLTGSRGLGGDLLAADVSQTFQRIKSRNSGDAKRVHTELNGDSKATLKEFQCNVSAPKRWVDPKTTARTKLALVEEGCRGDNMSFRNFYWVEPKSGHILKSRQWVSPALGYITLKFL